MLDMLTVPFNINRQFMFLEAGSMAMMKSVYCLHAKNLSIAKTNGKASRVFNIQELAHLPLFMVIIFMCSEDIQQNTKEFGQSNLFMKVMLGGENYHTSFMKVFKVF